MKRIDFTSSDFARLKSIDCLIVDKTRYIYHLLKSGNQFVVNTAPYGFGKSLIVSMLENLRISRRNLFTGMYVSNTDYDFAFHPVVRIRFSEFCSHSSLSVKEFVSDKLLSIATAYDVDIELSEPSRRLQLLCNELANKYQVKSAIIIDDYDLPLIVNNKDDIDSFNFLRGFYSSLKGLISFVHLIYLTGVYPPNMLGNFTEHSNVFDVSMNKKYSGFVGFTENELEAFMNPLISAGESLAELRKWYGDYCFIPESQRVYNPYSIMRFMYYKKYGRYFDYPQSSCLPSWHKPDREMLIADDSLYVSKGNLFIKEHLTDTEKLILLLKAGYLTIDYVDKELFYLRIPNSDVQLALNSLKGSKYETDC